MSGLNFQKILSPKTSQKIMNSIFVISGLVTILILIIILGYILIRGLPVVNLGFIFSNPIDSGASGGIFPMIVSSLYVTLIAGIVATPLGVGAQYTLLNLLVKVKSLNLLDLVQKLLLQSLLLFMVYLV